MHPIGAKRLRIGSRPLVPAARGSGLESGNVLVNAVAVVESIGKGRGRLEFEVEALGAGLPASLRCRRCREAFDLGNTLILHFDSSASRPFI